MTEQAKPDLLDEQAIAEIEARMAKLPEGPWFAAFDPAKECGPHRDSGLALVDTGRESDWPIARLCEWHAARFIAASITDIPALCQTVRAAWKERDDLLNQSHQTVFFECGCVFKQDGLDAEPQLTEHCTLWAEAERNAMIDTIAELEKEPAALRDQLAQAQVELQVVNGVACKEEQDAGNGPCGICRPCLQSRLAQAEKERFSLTEEEFRLLADHHYLAAERAITRRGDRACQQQHLERLAVIRATKEQP